MRNNGRLVDNGLQCIGGYAEPPAPSTKLSCDPPHTIEACRCDKGRPKADAQAYKEDLGFLILFATSTAML